MRRRELLESPTEYHISNLAFARAQKAARIAELKLATKYIRQEMPNKT